jgi:hypothetical protein
VDLPIGRVLKEESNPQFNSHVQLLQEELKKLSYYRSNPDGKFGPITKNAVIAFQKDQNLVQDGIVGPKTARALNIKVEAKDQKPQPAPEGDRRTSDVSVNTVLPRNIAGIYSYQSEARQYGRKVMIDALVKIGHRWTQLHPNGPRIGVGDISKQGGGEFSPHKSHRKGTDVDIRPVRSDGKQARTHHEVVEYSRGLTRELVKVFLDVGPVEFIFFNDPQLISEGLTRNWPGHNDHLHMRFKF